MPTVSVSIPEPMQKWVEEQVRDGEYADASEYVLNLIREDRERHDASRGDKQSGINSRSSAEDIWDTESDTPYLLDDEELADIEAAIEEVDRGEIASEAEVQAIFARYRA